MTDPLPDSRPGGQNGGYDLAALVAARICHDLVSPIGAIGNGVDLMRELGGGGEDLDLVAQSAGRAAAMVKLHRLAFGTADAAATPIGRRDFATRLEPVLSTRRVAFELASDGPDLPPPVARLGALMAMAARALLGMSGHLRLTLDPGASLPITAEAEGAQASWTAELESFAFNGAVDAQARHVEFLLLPGAARAAGARLEPLTGQGRAGLRAVPL